MINFPCPENTHPAIHDLWKWLNENKLVGFRDSLQRDDSTVPFQPRCFLPTHLLDSYLTESKIKELLQALNGRQHRDSHSEFIPALKQTCQIVFVILILLDAGPTIQAFVDDNYNWGDHLLPFKADGDGSNFPAGAANFAKFCELQHSFKPALFDNTLPRTIGRDRILPFKSVTRVGKGSSADVWKVEMHEGYASSLKPGQQSIKPADRRPGTVFVLKRFRPGVRPKDVAEMYDNEVKIYEKISRDQPREPGIVGFHGCFAVTDIVGEQKTILSWNIILDHADKGNLNEFFENADSHQPMTAAECLCFLRKISVLFGAVSRIHRLGDERRGAGAVQGAHHDIKPSNILVTTDDRNPSDPWPFRFMLADFGLATVTKMNDSNTTIDPSGTKECGAPEVARNQGEIGWELEVTQKVDVWSLACIMSQALVWCILGQQKWRRYAQQRAKDSRDGVACFHDGAKVLTCVLGYHQEAIRSIRANDDFTEKIVHLLEHDMFVAAESRSRPQELRSRATDILKRSVVVKEEPLMNPPSPVAPREEDETTLPGRGRRPSTTPEGRKDGARLDSQPLDTRNRSPENDSSGRAMQPDQNLHIMSRKRLSAWRKGDRQGNKENIAYRERLRGRDIVFIIDDSKTMSSHSGRMEKLLGDLAYFVKVCDEDGMELKFMSGAAGCHDRHSTPLVDHLSKRREWYSIPTEAEAFLERVFSDYADRWQREKEMPSAGHHRHSLWGKLANRIERFLGEPIKPVSYFIFTDAVWQENSQVHRPIRKLLQRLQGSDEHQVAISFIQFGHDAVGTERLRFLDEDLVKTYGAKFGFDRDIVDCVREDGDVIKMMVGALDNKFDKIGEKPAKNASGELQG